jgi:hypothetical protein
MRYALDLTRNAGVIPSGDLVLIKTWIFNPDQQDYEPCLVIVPRYRRSGYKPCCIALSAAWKYNPEHNGVAYLARAAKEFLYMLGMDDCLSNAMKVADLVNSHLGDLIRMPNNPTQAIVTADASFTFDDGTRRTIEVVSHKPLAQA